jgi:DNA-binding SARP family transcriptional activator/WD40 repeat protein
MKIRVLGPLEVVVDDRILALGGSRQRALLALLIADSPHSILTEQLIGGIWGEDASPGTRSSLQTYVSNLRQVLGGKILFDRGSYRLDVDPESIDAATFVEALEGARSRLTTDPEGVSADLRSVLATWRGRPYADLIDIPGLEPEIRRLEALRLEAVELRVEADLAVGHDADLVAELEALAEEHPTRERFRAQHMTALYRSGRQAEALKAYRRTETYLAEELGVSPSRELQDLELRILEQDDSLSAGISTPITQRLAFMVTDIEGSTTHWDRFPQAMAAALTTHDAILGEEVDSAGGRVFKHTGDGVVAVFPNAHAAAVAAEGIQNRVAREDWEDVGELRVRIGIDAGEAEERGGDFFGPPLNRAARLCAIAHGGQVLVSAAAEREVTAIAPAGLQIRHLGEAKLRGMATPERIVQLVFVGLPADFPDLKLDADPTLNGRSEPLSLPGYEVRDRIGEGAFGVVWRAYQPSVGREVAIKVIRPELAADPSFVRRFEAEARTIARLAHPHIVPLIDFWRSADTAYLVLGLLRGGSLADALETSHIEESTARRILAQVASALDHAHSQGVAHGDLKPANLLLDGGGNAYLSDFGIAARLISSRSRSYVSSAPQYRAPEESTTGPTQATDRFAMGVLARELLNGSSELEPVLARATSLDPGRRYESALAFVRDIESALGGEVAEFEQVTVARNPYKGLRSFDEGDAADFFGRDDLVAAILTALRRNGLVAVVGPSGSGKSSVVHSGAVPLLVSTAVEGLERAIVVSLTPGATPVDTLVQALAVAGGGRSASDVAGSMERLSIDGVPVLVVDQFEEIYTHVDDIDTQRQFVDLLLEVIEKGGRVLITLRADYYDRPLGDERIAGLIRDGQVTVLPPTRDELIEMVTAPARAVGLRWEPGLPHRIVEDVAHQPGGLPLLQYALTELVERRGSDLLTATDYERIGGVTGALANRAEALFGGLTPAQQSATHQIMLRLVTVDEDGGDTRRRVRRSELESLGLAPGDLDDVLETFTTDRLLFADRDPVSRTPTVEVSHEALLREWPRLRSWIDDQREALILGRRFRAAMGEWEANNRDDDYLLTGSRLAPFMAWAGTSSLASEERTFYEASLAHDEAERAARRRRRRVLTTILAGAAVVGITLGSVAAVQASRATREAEAARDAESVAQEEAERAEVAANVARSRELSASAEAALDADPSLAKLLAVASTQIAEPTADTTSILHRTFAADREVSRYVWENGDLLSADLHPDGAVIAAAGVEPGRLEVFDMERDELLWVWQSEGGTAIDEPHFTSDGAHLLGGVFPDGDDPAGELGIHMWETGSGELVRVYDPGECGRGVFRVVENLAFTFEPSGECEWIYTTVGVLDLESGSWRELVTEALEFVTSGDGRFFAYTDDTTTHVVDVATGEVVLDFPRGTHPGPSPDGRVRLLNHDGSLLLAGERPVAVWDVSAGEIVAEFYGHPGEIVHGAISEDGETVYTSGREGTLKRWSMADGREVASFPAVGSGVVSVAGDRILVTDGATDQARLLDSSTRAEVWGADTCEGFTLSTGLTRVADTIALAQVCGDSADQRTFLIDVDSHDVREWDRFFGQHQSISPDGTRLVRQEQVAEPRVTDDGVILTIGPPAIRDVETGDVLVELQGTCVFELPWVGPESLEGCVGYPSTPFDMGINFHTTWTLDSAYVVNVRPGVTVWDAATGEIVAILDLETAESCGPSHVLVTPEGDRLLFGCYADGAEEILELSTDTWEFSLRDAEGWRFGSLAGITPNNQHLVGIGNFIGHGPASLLWLDAETFKVVESFEEITRGSAKSFAVSPDGRLLALGTSEGFVHIWDVVERRPVQEFFVAPTQMQGVTFVSDTHLAVAPQTGGIFVYTLDPEELNEVVAASLTRGFTPAECDRYGFGDDCPTLEELSGT